MRQGGLEGVQKADLEGVRILHVHTLPVVSGSGINTFLTMKGARDAGAEVALACAPGGRLQELVERSGMQFFPIRCFVSELSPAKDLCAIVQLWRLLRRERFDIVHSHNSKAGFAGRLTARLNRVPIVVHTVHGWAFHEAERPLFRKLYARLERVAASWADRLIAISEPLIDRAQKEGIVAPERFAKIFSGVAVEDFESAKTDPSLRHRFGISDDEIVLGEVAKLWEGKGHEVLLRATERLKEKRYRFKVLLVGEGPLEEKLRARVREMELEDIVVFTGFCANVAGVTAILDVSVLPTFFEGMGRVVLEAMAAGKPVVASSVGGIPELVIEGKNGFLVPPGDATALAERLERLIEDPSLRRAMGRTAREMLRPEHTAQYMIEQVNHLYRQELDRRV